MLVEPPGPVLPPRSGLIIPAVERLRAAAAAAALVLAVTSRGDALGLATLLAVVAWRPLAAAAAGAGLIAASWRWGSTSLEAIAGAQAVLGPAGLVEPASAATASWLAASALVLVTGRLRAPGAGPAPRALHALSAAATGAAAAVVVAGPAPGGDVWVRVLAGVLATGLAAAVVAVRGKGGRVPVVVDGLALTAGVAALVAVGPDAPAWSGTVDLSAVGHGAVTAMAVAAVAIAGASAAAMGRRQP